MTDTKIDETVRLLDACVDGFVANTELAFDGNYSRLSSLGREVFSGLPFKTVSQLLDLPISGLEIWRLTPGDYVLPQCWVPADKHELSFLILDGFDADGVSVSTAHSTLKVRGGGSIHCVKDPCRFWISPVRDRVLTLAVSGRLSGEL